MHSLFDFQRSKRSIGRTYNQTVMDEETTLCEYIAQSFMFCTFGKYTFLLKLFHTVEAK